MKNSFLIDEEIRSPAIRLVTNKLFCLNIPLITNIIEDFARNLMFSVVSFQVKEFEKKESSESSESSESKENKDTMDEIKNELENGKFLSEDEIKRYLFLYFALCTKKHELLSGLDNYYYYHILIFIELLNFIFNHLLLLNI